MSFNPTAERTQGPLRNRPMAIIDTTIATSPSPVYLASDIKPVQADEEAITSIKNAIIDILEKDNPQTVRKSSMR